MPINTPFAKTPQRGMIVRSQETIEPGIDLVKFGHRFVNGQRMSDIEVVSTPWWLTKETAEYIIERADASDARLADVFRRFGAVAKRWGGSGDLVVKVTVAKAVMACIGPGTVQDFRGQKGEEIRNQWDAPLWVPSPLIAQVHIPVAERSRVKQTTVARQAYRNAFVVSIDKWRDDYLWENPPEKWRVF